MLAALFCIAAVLGFHAGDEPYIVTLPWYEIFSSAARAVAGTIHNPFGLFGARVSVFFIRVLLGYPMLLPLAGFLVLGWRLFRTKPLDPALLFLVYTLLMALDLSAMFGLSAAPFADVMSGTTGRMMASFLSTIIGYPGAWALTTVIGVLLTFYMGWEFITDTIARVSAFFAKASATVRMIRAERTRKRREKEEMQARKKAERMAVVLEKERKKREKKEQRAAKSTPPKPKAAAVEKPVKPPVSLRDEEPESAPPPPPVKLPAIEPIVIPAEVEEIQAPEPAIVRSEEGPDMIINPGVREAEADLDERKLKVRTHDHVQYRFPSIDLLQRPKDEDESYDERHLAETKDRLLEKLRIYKIEVIRIATTVGPRVALFELELAPEVKISRIKSLENDLAMAMASSSGGIRIIAPIPGKNAIGVEIPISKPRPVVMRSVLQVEKFKNNTMALPIVLGKSISNEVVVDDLAAMPHLLIAGATGAGKSVAINVLLTSLLYSKKPDEVKFVLIDPKRVELKPYKLLKDHFLPKIPGMEEQIIVTDPQKAVSALRSVVREMEHRYEMLEKCGVRNIGEYNRKMKDEAMFYLVVVVDELADLMITAGREVEEPITRLAQMARAVGIHLIVATQRPSVDVITGIIKANFPSRIAFQVASKVDSRTILDVSGAEQLLGSGDMLFQSARMSKPERIQCPFISLTEVDAITEFIGDQPPLKTECILPEPPSSNGNGFSSGLDQDRDRRDAMFEEAARLVVLHQQASVSLLQRRLRLGFSRAGRVMDQLERNGIVSAGDGSKPRDVLVKNEDSLELLLRNLD
ncbi:cell division protein FtsK [Chlorobaculum limnaeum]|uniref:Cell division protein FtsK n=1 Tax=Chlorobaculum limnaeum TaxID=274537 RepID=A0A1D8D1D7_CHLLM|nr:DNA translocase FtsK [Chlorobaculum limnaeum]AOS84966.1 cell division protein FtsK [Chlorobaculum limnaeum]